MLHGSLAWNMFTRAEKVKSFEIRFGEKDTHF